VKHTNDVHVPEAPIRTAALALLLVAAAAAPLHAAFTETHLNEITAPVADYAAARIVALEALPAPTKAEKKELKLLRALSKRLSKTAFNLRQDFAELAAASTAQDQLGLAGAPMQTAADEMLRRANLSLSERVELGRDYLAELIDAKHRAAVQKKIDAVTKLRTAVAAATKAGKRGGLLVKANAAVTGLLKTADKHVLKDAGASKVPPTRWRSGDTIGFGGGRVAVPKDAISPIAGASAGRTSPRALPSPSAPTRPSSPAARRSTSPTSSPPTRRRSTSRSSPRGRRSRRCSAARRAPTARTR
jgi:hypothetical protein